MTSGHESESGEGASSESVDDQAETQDLPSLRSETGHWTDSTVFADDASKDPLVGASVEHYAVLSVLGSGGFGTVYRAHDTKLNRDVALKFLRDPSVRETLALFKREAEAIAALSNHDHIVDIHTWGEYEGYTYFVLEFVESGATQLLEQHPRGLPLRFALRIAAECAEALAYAHERGILHRDVKPANILFEKERQRAKLADFGLARLYERGEITISGGISGSPPYMSPEQAKGDDLDERTDIFSLGVTLHELLCGGRAFEGDTSLEIIERVKAGKKEDLSKHRRNLPQFVLELVDKATAHQRDLRFQSAQEFADALRGALVQLEKMPEVEDEPPPPLQGKKVRKVILAAAAVLLLCAVGLAYWFYPAPLSEDVITLVKQGDEKLDSGDAQGAEALYQRVVQKAPDNEGARYGLGYAFLRQGSPDDAEAQFTKLSDASLRSEGVASVAFERNPLQARPRIEAVLDAVKTGYPPTLLASLDISEGDYATASDRLKSVATRPFSFGWQRAEYLQALGQAQYHLGEYEDALSTFQRLSQSSPPMAASFADAYIGMIESQQDEARREWISDEIEKLKQVIDSEEGQRTPIDPWRSRPLRVCILPAEAGNSSIALRSGLAGAVAALLATPLERTRPLDVVDRDLLEEVLMEQEISAKLGTNTEDGKLRLGHVLGARLLIKCSFSSLFNEDFVTTKVVDTETTIGIPLEDLNVPRKLDRKQWFQDLAALIWSGVSDEYPIRGKVLRGEDGPEIDIGSAVGVTEGMRFQVAMKPDTQHILPGRTVIVEGPVGENGAKAKIEGFGLEDIPEEGWYITAEGGETKSGAQGSE